jgi:hypothetical protein
MIPVLKVGCKAYYDSFRGLVPVKVTYVSGSSSVPSSSIRVKAKVTCDFGPYHKGEEIEFPSLWIIPAKALIRGQYTYTIGAYGVVGN